jgi:hypothetical protein
MGAQSLSHSHRLARVYSWNGAEKRSLGGTTDCSNVWELWELEDLSDASFLGKLLVLPANVRLDWKVFVRCKHSSLFGLIISNEEKSFITLTPGCRF